jgi:hypothetical protein
MRSRDRLKARALDRSLQRLAFRDLIFGERGPEQFAAGCLVASPPGPEVSTLPQGHRVVSRWFTPDAPDAPDEADDVIGATS